MGGSSPPSTRTSDPVSCPKALPAIVTGPAPGIVPSSWLDVVLVGTPASPSVVVVDPVTGKPVGSLAGVSGLARLVRCILDGETYRAYVDSVSGGRVAVTVTLQ